MTAMARSPAMAPGFMAMMWKTGMKFGEKFWRLLLKGIRSGLLCLVVGAAAMWLSGAIFGHSWPGAAVFFYMFFRYVAPISVELNKELGRLNSELSMDE
ncbi:MAG: hypothetical protein IID51_10820 [Proteobacteria bacterium]|nr:hypothetical protein [Pseudomonadota bacterium]